MVSRHVLVVESVDAIITAVGAMSGMFTGTIV